MSFTKFPSIESFAHVWRSMARRFNPAPTRYGAKIKLHGTNAGVRIDKDGYVTAQSRSRDLTLDSDNAGFAAWVDRTCEQWTFYPPAIHDMVFHDVEKVIYFGEWAGKGIQRKDAVTQLDGKFFFVFAVQIDDRIITDPVLIEAMCPDIDNLIVLPWHMDFESSVDWSDPTAANAWVDILNEEVERIGECDPFIKDIFGIEGVGEGLVLMPNTTGNSDGIERDEFATQTFKAKSEAHRVKKTEKAVSKRVEVPEGVPEFVEAFVTEARCQQGLVEACDGIAEKPRTADFLKWIGGDVKKESEAELADMGLEWPQVAKHVNKAAVNWFMHACNRIADAA